MLLQDLMIDDTHLLLFAGRAALLAAAFIGFALAFGRWRRAGAREMESLRQTLEESRTQTQGLAELTAGLAGRLDELTRMLEDRRELAHASVAPAGGGIELAVRMARQGSNADEIAKTCGVTRPEAQLLVRLHGTEAARIA